MNPTNENIFCEDDRRFDLLVDGEMSESQRRELLAGLDDQPDGWRRCALAFLDAQCWRDELGSMVHEAVEPASTAPTWRSPSCAAPAARSS